MNDCLSHLSPRPNDYTVVDFEVWLPQARQFFKSIPEWLYRHWKRGLAQAPHGTPVR